MRLAAAWWPAHKDAGAWAEAIHDRAPGPIHEVVFVEDMARYGLHLHLGVEVERIALDLPPRRGYPERSFDQDLRSDLTEREPDVVWIAKRERWDELQDLPGPTGGWMNVTAVACSRSGKQYASIWGAASERRAALVPEQDKCRRMHAPT